MTKTKKGFMIAGGVLGIISSTLIILCGALLFMCIGYVNVAMLEEILAQDSIAFTSEELSQFVTLFKQFFTVSGITLLAFGAVNLVFSILVIVNAAKGNCKKGSVITLLVLSVLTGNILTAAFMIVVLCLKNKVETNNNNDTNNTVTVSTDY